ncbi:MAG: TauD/TfdA family dioxygenase [Rhodospirillaceae bacterium]|jgi:taurine dioxygenase
MDGATSTLRITPLSEHIGAEVTGIDLKQPLDPETKAKLNQALLDHIALVIRDQSFSAPEYAEAVRAFGKPMMQHYSQYQTPDNEFVNFISNQHTNDKGERVKHGASWHTDHTNHECPPKCTVLYAVELPKEGGDTGILNTRAGYDSLLDDYKQKLDGLKTINVFQGRAALRESTKQVTERDAKKYSEAMVQPLIRTHPETGKKAVYFHTVKVDTIEGMEPDETRVLLEDVLGRINKPEFIYRHKWRLGDMLIWDNRSAMHQAYYDYDTSQPRTLMRIILEGDKPF